jgi:hypothetical protein
MAPNQALTDRFEGDAFFISEVGQPEFPPRITCWNAGRPDSRSCA